jgi:hypothetical protein
MSEWDFHVDGPDAWGLDGTDGYDPDAADPAANWHAHFDVDQHDYLDGHGEHGDWDVDLDDHVDISDHADHSDSAEHVDDLVLDDIHFDDDFTGHYDLVGADPDEQGLWDQLMLDLNDDVNPYVGRLT